MKLAVIAGDGIGPEVIDEALGVLDAVLPGVDKTTYDLGARRYHATGEVLPEGVLDELRTHDAILLGAIGDPSVPSGVLERGLLLKTRFELDHHVNLRPSRLYDGVSSPLAGDPKIDFLGARSASTRLVANDLTSTPEPAPSALIVSVAIQSSSEFKGGHQKNKSVFLNET
jgi:3-isopropylmalate dehydrogenase